MTAVPTTRARIAHVEAAIAATIDHDQWVVGEHPPGTVAVAWCDGPTPTRLTTVLPDTFPDGHPSRYCLHRTVGLELAAVDALRGTRPHRRATPT
jgi:hypothetical protein